MSSLVRTSPTNVLVLITRTIQQFQFGTLEPWENGGEATK